MKVKHLNFLRHSELGCQPFSNMQQQISLNTLKLHNDRLDELINRLDKHFGWQPVHPKESIESIMYRSGQASVIEYIKSIMDEEI